MHAIQLVHLQQENSYQWLIYVRYTYSRLIQYVKYTLSTHPACSSYKETYTGLAATHCFYKYTGSLPVFDTVHIPQTTEETTKS
jgi:hypothetical protein